MITREDIFILARTIYGEARNQTAKEQRAVAHVIINRTDKRVGDRDHSLAATCLRHWQFSAWLESDPNRKKLQGATVASTIFRKCLIAAITAIDEADFTKGATHYHTKAIAPYWSTGHSPCYEGSDHVFYNTVK